jgi:putative spermidine/putrescine transport system substrate-binding protein
MLKLLKATFLSTMMFAIASTAYADITFVSWGGAYTASQQKAYVDTWSKGSGVTVENYNGGLGEIKAQVEAGNVTWDVVDVLPDQAITGCDEGLFAKVDQSSFVNDMVVAPVSECVVPQIFWAYTAFYSKSAFPGKKPKNIKNRYKKTKYKTIKYIIMGKLKKDKLIIIVKNIWGKFCISKEM